MPDQAHPPLNDHNLASAASSARMPNYDRTKVNIGIVHLGIGAFHRAHQAVYVDRLLADDPHWGIVGVSLRRADTKDALAPQNGLYTVAVKDGEGVHPEVIGSIKEVLVLGDDRDAIMAHLTAPTTRIVSLTVTEKGYCHDPATGQLDEKNADIVHDLANPETPLSAPGLIVEALARRWTQGIAPFTVMSCDNLPANGQTCRRIVTRFAALRAPELGAWVDAHVAFPSTMVDRIVPATTDELRAEVDAALGLADAWPVAAEPFTQWVIEDHFPSGRPAFEQVGAELVDDVEPFELMKLRLLNGSHSTLAYLGYLSGYQYVSGAVSDPQFETLLRTMMRKEIMPTLTVPGLDLDAYCDALIHRFLNPALRHRTWQIAMDGSQKLPQRLLGTIRDRIAKDAPFDRLALGVAAWMSYVSGTDEQHQPIDIRDPMSARFAEISEKHDGDLDAYLDALLSLEEIFGADLPKHQGFRATVLAHLKSLFEQGALKTIAALNLALR